jgi:hypothetical protein
MHMRALGHRPGPAHRSASVTAICHGRTPLAPPKAAADRERRLALSSALARQSVAVGLSPDDVRAIALYGSTTAVGPQYEHVLAVARQLAAQNEALAAAVAGNSAALAEQQVGRSWRAASLSVHRIHYGLTRPQAQP